MARFPKREDEIHALINRMISGYEAYPAEFPNADPVGLRVVRDEYQNYKVGQLCKQAWAHLATEAKDLALEALVIEMESQLTQSEVDTSGDAMELELIGWSEHTPCAAPFIIHHSDIPQPPTPIHHSSLIIHHSSQPLRTQLEYRVVAMNNAGTSVPSNSVAAVL